MSKPLPPRLHHRRLNRQAREQNCPQREPVPSAASDNPSSATMGTDSPPRQDGPPIVDEETSMARAEPSQTGNVPPTAGVEPSADESLFAVDDLSGLRSRWDDVQVAFVDNPTECVQTAEALVAEGRRTGHRRFLRGALAPRGAVGSRSGRLHGGITSRPEALPRVLPAAARSLRLFHTGLSERRAAPSSPLSADEFPG
jgi:hypothetical protein